MKVFFPFFLIFVTTLFSLDLPVIKAKNGSAVLLSEKKEPAIVIKQWSREEGSSLLENVQSVVLDLKSVDRDLGKSHIKATLLGVEKKITLNGLKKGESKRIYLSFVPVAIIQNSIKTELLLHIKESDNSWNFTMESSLNRAALNGVITGDFDKKEIYVGTKRVTTLKREENIFYLPLFSKKSYTFLLYSKTKEEFFIKLHDSVVLDSKSELFKELFNMKVSETKSNSGYVTKVTFSLPELIDLKGEREEVLNLREFNKILPLDGLTVTSSSPKLKAFYREGKLYIEDLGKRKSFTKIAVENKSREIQSFMVFPTVYKEQERKLERVKATLTGKTIREAPIYSKTGERISTVKKGEAIEGEIVNKNRILYKNGKWLIDIEDTDIEFSFYVKPKFFLRERPKGKALLFNEKYSEATGSFYNEEWLKLKTIGGKKIDAFIHKSGIKVER